MLTLSQSTSIPDHIFFLLFIFPKVRVNSISRNFYDQKECRQINEYRLHCISNYCNIYREDINDIVAFNLLQCIESNSPAKVVNQKVGCILFGRKNSQIVPIVTTNTYLENTGVHAELNAISVYLNLLPEYSSINYPISFLNMLVTYSPCLECTKLIEYIPEIKNIKYSFKHDDNAITILEKNIDIRKLDIPYEKKNLKLHSYSRIHWVPEVKNAIVRREFDGHFILQCFEKDAFDIRPFAILAMRKRKSILEVHVMYKYFFYKFFCLLITCTGIHACL